MAPPQPLLDPLLWLRWGAAAAALLWGPGHLLAGRHLRGADRAARFAVSVAAGLVLAVLAGVAAAWAGLPLTPWPYAALAAATGVAAGRAPAWRAAVTALAPAPRPSRAATAAVAAAVAVAALLLLAGYGDLSAPPHVRDASNHAFIVQRIAATGRAGAGDLFAGLPARPALGYLPGWHVPAALVARLGGVPPYVSAWFLPLALAALLPAALALAWRTWGAPAAACGLGALLATGSRLVPGGILEWGGFGQVAGLFLLPVLLAALGALRARPTVAGTLLAGALWAALARVHSSEAAAAVPLLLLARPADPAPGDRFARAALGAAAVALLLVGPDAWALSRDYAGAIAAGAPAPPERLGYSLEKFLKAGGRTPGLIALTSTGLLWGLARRAWRPVALAAVGVGALFVGLAAGRDPVTAWLGLPFYREAPRVLYLTALLIPALAALPLLAGRDRLARGRRGPGPALALAAVVAATLLPAWPDVVRGHRENAASVPFTPAEHALAARLPALVPAGALVANFWDDGSTWAMHVSGRRFLLPMSWPLLLADGQSAEAVLRDLTRRPWPASVRRLQALGAGHLWVCDRRWRGERVPGPDNAAFASDPRFERVATGGAAALYRIRWEAE